MPTDGVLVVPYGCAAVPAGWRAGDASVPVIALAAGAPLRLGGGGYAFAEPPDPARLRDAAARLDVVRGHLQALCDLWARPQRHLVDVYLALVVQRVVAQADALAARLAPFGGLYAVEDFAFAALRPLPRAQLAVDGGWTATDFLLWTGTEAIALEITDGRRTRRQREGAAAHLRAAGATVIELPPDLEAAGLASRLPDALLDFCAGVELPPSPFAAVRIGAIVDGDERI